jgi:hypothetical protein|nr:MAG: hypothetical protein [Bacteriophage sp.]DAP58037.1 MAG TPA: hypothetical protein [Caudoviricetes sp.]
MMEFTTKFNPGDLVWTICDNKVHSFVIARIEMSIRAAYRNDGTLHPSPNIREVYVEEIHTHTRNNTKTAFHNWYDCFATKEELIKNL